MHCFGFDYRCDILKAGNMFINQDSVVELRTRQKHDSLHERLYREHSQNMCKYLNRAYGSGPPEPEDVVHEVFLKARQSERLEEVENPKAFLYKMAVNMMLNAKARVRFINDYIAEQINAPQWSNESLGPETISCDRDELARLGKGVEKLSNSQREVFVRSRLRGETYAEISQALGLSQADISRQLRSALAILLKESRQAADGEE